MKPKHKSLHPKEIDELVVYKKGVKAGMLQRTVEGCRFSLLQDFVGDVKFSEFSFTISKKNTPIHLSGANLPPFFSGLLPEGFRLKAIFQNLKTSQDDMFSVLAATGARTIGDIYTQIPGTTRPPDDVLDLSAEDFYKVLEAQLKSINQNAEFIPGVQEKLSASMISFPIGVRDVRRACILKLNPREYPNLVENEYWCLELAKKCGLAVNEARLVHDKREHKALLVERFDRGADQQNPQTFIHQEDACQFMDRYPGDKYRLNMRDICEKIYELASAPKIEIQKLLELYAFSFLIGNGDLHAKNISLFVDPETERVSLTPSYDLLCTFIHGDENMALKLDGRTANIRCKDLISFADRFEIREQAVKSMLAKLLKRFQMHQNLLFQMPIDEKQKRKLSKMIKERITSLSKGLD